MSFAMRPGTLDEYVYNQVLEANEYGLPDAFCESDVVVDVGAHIGAFALAALERGAGKVYCIEPDPENFELARANLSHFIHAGRAHVIQAAAWRSDPNDDALYFQRGEQLGDVINTGGGRVSKAALGDPVAKVDFDVFLAEVTLNGSRPVRFLKLDCEGAEWPILFTSRKLEWVQELAGEIHETRITPVAKPSSSELFRDQPLEALLSLLEGQGFDVQYRPCWLDMPHFERLGLLSASRTRNSSELGRTG